MTSWIASQRLKTAFGAAALSAGLVLGTMAAQAAPSVDAPAPDFSVIDSNGKTHQLSDYRGKTVVLEWTNHLCPYVQKHYSSGNMQKLQKDAAGNGVVWLTVVSSSKGTQGSVDGDAANKLTQDREAVPAAVLLDESGVVGKAYDAKTTPHMYVIDKSGTLRYMGAIDDQPTAAPTDMSAAENYVKAALNAVADGGEVAKKTTQPYGCSVKYKS